MVLVVPEAAAVDGYLAFPKPVNTAEAIPVAAVSAATGLPALE
jgi:hypothetical protein